MKQRALSRILCGLILTAVCLAGREPALAEVVRYEFLSGMAEIRHVGLSASSLGDSPTDNTPNNLRLANVTSGNNQYPYLAVTFIPSDTATYTFGQFSSPYDTVMLLYQGIFEPDNPDTGLLVGDDDTAHSYHNTVLAGSFYEGNMGQCGSSSTYCPQVYWDVVAEQVYTLVVSVYNYSSYQLSLPIVFYSNGSGIFGTYTPPGTIGPNDEFYVPDQVDNGDVVPVFEGGTLKMTDDGDTNSVNFALSDNADNAIDQNGIDSEFTGVFSDNVPGTPGTIRITNSDANGGGSVIFSGENSYTGLTVVENNAFLNIGDTGSIAGDALVLGRMDVEGRVGGTVILEGGLLAGKGAIGGSLHAGPGSIIAPAGENIGTLTVEGDAGLDGSTYLADIDPSGVNSDLLHILGEAALMGSTLVLGPGPGSWDAPGPEGEWVLLKADGGLNGIFDNVINNWAFLDAELIYTEDSVILRFVRNNTEFSDFAETPNEQAVAGALDSLGPENPLYGKMVGQPGGIDMGALYNQLSGEAYASLPGMLQGYERSFSRSMQARFHDISRFSGFTRFPSGTGQYDDGRTEKDWREGYPLWATLEGQRSKTDGTRNTAGATFEGMALSLGGEKFFGDKWLAGVAFRFGDNRLSVSDRGSDADIYSFDVGAYAGTYAEAGPGRINLTFGVSYGLHNVESERWVYLGSLSRLEADYNAQSFQAFAEAGYELAISERDRIEPYLGLVWNSVWTEDFSESGGVAALHADSNHQGNLSSNLGLRWERRLGKKASLFTDVRWQHTYGSLDPDAEFAFSGSSKFTVAGAPLDRDAAGLNVGLNFQVSEKATLRASYDGLYGEDSTSHGGFLTVICRF